MSALITIWRDPVHVEDNQLRDLRDRLKTAVPAVLKIPVETLEMRMHDYGPLDIMPGAVRVEIETDAGRHGSRIANLQDNAALLAEALRRCTSEDFPWNTLWEGSGIWLRVCHVEYVAIVPPHRTR